MKDESMPRLRYGRLVSRLPGGRYAHRESPDLLWRAGAPHWQGSRQCFSRVVDRQQLRYPCRCASQASLYFINHAHTVATITRSNKGGYMSRYKPSRAGSSRSLNTSFEYDPFPDGHYIHPFHQGRYYSRSEGKEHPRTVVEMRMCALSNAIREKPNWWEQIKDRSLVKKWMREAVDQQKNEYRIRQLTLKMVNYVFQELHGYASIRDPNTGIEAGPYERIWRSDSLISDDLRNQLVNAVSPLENVPDGEKNWQPRSENQVLSLVHPYLYPIIYNRTLIEDPRTGKCEALRPPSALEFYVSQKFQWLPSDFTVAEDGSVTLASPYINNIHPQKHAALESVVPKLLERAVPLWERVLSDLRRPLLPFRTKPTPGNPLPDCVFQGVGEPRLEDEGANLGMDARLSKLNLNLPDARDGYTGDLSVMKTPTVSLKGATIQCIIKLVNIVLTPEKPEYAGGNWHVEGMENERIVSSFIYYYDCENITTSRLAFRRATCVPGHHRPGDSHCMHVLYDFDRFDRSLQDLGSVETIQGRCVAFPNIYQHQVQPFRLRDPTKPGLRKIFVAFLVDPTYTIPSATIIAPQQREIIRDAMLEAGNSSWLGRLPVELIDDIASGNDGTLSRAEAEAYRLEIMDERTAFVRASDSSYFGTNFPLLRGD
ncbi:hypothetical protein BJ322DRAFT_1203235 [Thelephora terrestris]|uniref:Uncharacterized protein n=1 Tax=Thelephora terrestris TaxID=56493 RepID=A0A9P6L9T3_9AGAM|nr:hypothetical protein BJ322DRAFT_1203235 [Thelephora terrestris]